MAVAAGKLVVMQPLPLVPTGSVVVADGVSLLEDEGGSGTVFIWGQATWTWNGSDPGARRLAAVQLVNSGAASQRQVAAAFGANETTVWRWRSDYQTGGLVVLLPQRKGPKRPSKLTDEKRAEIARLRSSGLTKSEVAARTGVSTQSVRRATLDVTVVPSPSPGVESLAGADQPNNLVPLNAPIERTGEREAARRGMLDEAAPVICEGGSLPFVGSLVILPALMATGLLEATASIYGLGRRVAGTTRSAFYGLRSLVLCVVFASLVGEPRVEGLTRLDPQAIGRLLGLDRAPEVSRLRFRLGELAEEKKSDELVMALARRHIEVHPEAVGLFYIDGHVRAYHGKREVPKAHVARMRIAMPAEVDTWVSDRFGDGLLVWQAAPGASLVGELKIVVGKVRDLVGAHARPTICFDRGGWSPKLFAQLDEAGFDVLTYRKAPLPQEPRSAFQPVRFTDDLGHTHDYLLADRPVRLSYDNKRHRFACRQITRLDAASGHQTQIVTTRSDRDPALVAYAMFSRWRQENFFRYQRAHFALDALDAYETQPDDLTRLVANPARRDGERALRKARQQLTDAEAREGSASLEGRRANKVLKAAFRDARAEVARLDDVAKAISAKVPLGDVRPDAVRLDVERKRIMDAIRMATYNAESALARMIAPHYARADDEARTLLREIFKSPADLEIRGDKLHVRILPLSAPRRTKAMAKLCEDLTATETLYPGTDLTLVYSVRES